MHKNIVISLLLMVVILSCTPSLAQASQAIDAVQKRYDSVTATRSEFSQILLHKESGAIERRKGILFFQKPLLVRWETETPSPELLVVTASEVWNYFEDENLAYKYPLNLLEDSSNIIKVLTGQAKIKQDFDVEEEGQEDGLLKLRLYPRNPTQSLVEAVLWTDPKTNLITRFRLYDFYGNENDITFTKQEIDPKIPASAFHYVPDKSTTVEDRTESGAVETPLLK